MTAYIVIGVIAVPFTMFGIDWLFTAQPGSEAVIKINGESVTAKDLEWEMDLRRRYYANNELEMPLDETLRQAALSNLIAQRALRQEATDWGLEIPDRLVDAHIRKVPEFQRGGAFSREIYQQTLRDSGYTPSMYRDIVNRQLLQAQLMSGFVDTAFVTASHLRQIVSVSEQRRRFDWILLDIGSLMEQIVVDAAEARADYDAYPEKFMSEESVVVNYAELKREDFYSVMSEKALREQYALYVETLNEERRAAHILLELDGTGSGADVAREQLLEIKRQITEEGADFAELAEARSDDIGSARNGGNLGTSRGDTFPKLFEEALAALAIGAVSDPVVTDAGMHLIKRLSTDVPEYDEVVERIRDSMQRQQSANAFADAAEVLDEFAFSEPDLSDIYEAMALKVQTSEPFSRNLSEGLFANPKLVRAAFSPEVLQEGRNSPVIEVSPDHLVVLHLSEHLPPALRDFDAVRELIQVRLRRERAQAQASSRADVLVSALATTPAEALAAEHGLTVQHVDLQSRGDAADSVDREVVQFVFALPRPVEGRPAAGRVATSEGDIAVVAVLDVRDGETDSLTSEEIDRITEYVLSDEGNAIAEAYRQSLFRRTEIDTL